MFFLGLIIGLAVGIFAMRHEKVRFAVDDLLERIGL